MELKNLKLDLKEGVSKKTNRSYSKIDLILPNGLILASVFLNAKDLYLVKNSK